MSGQLIYGLVFLLLPGPIAPPRLYSPLIYQAAGFGSWPAKGSRENRDHQKRKPEPIEANSFFIEGGDALDRAIVFSEASDQIVKDFQYFLLSLMIFASPHLTSSEKALKPGITVPG